MNQISFSVTIVTKAEIGINITPLILVFVEDCFSLHLGGMIKCFD